MWWVPRRVNLRRGGRAGLERRAPRGRGRNPRGPSRLVGVALGRHPDREVLL